MLQIALKFAAQAGNDRSPTLVQYGEGTRRQADLVGSGGDVTHGDQPCYLIAMRGHFVALTASLPAGAQLPKGRVMTLVISATSGHLFDLGVGNRYPDLQTLGRVVTAAH